MKYKEYIKDTKLSMHPIEIHGDTAAEKYIDMNGRSMVQFGCYQHLYRQK